MTFRLDDLRALDEKTPLGLMDSINKATKLKVLLVLTTVRRDKLYFLRQN